MTFVVTENCIKCKHTDCVENCPVECFFEGPNFLVINPDECIDCNQCVPDCPIDAIYSEENLPDDQLHMLEINESYSKKWPRIVEVKAPLPDAEKWDGVQGKLNYLDDYNTV